jgi:hypothetical protein
MSGLLADEAIRRAHACGTLNAIDRSKQYERADTDEILRALNQAWAKIRVCEKAIQSRDAEILSLKAKLSRYKVANIALTSVITGLCWEGVKAFLFHFSHLAR